MGSSESMEESMGIDGVSFDRSEPRTSDRACAGGSRILLFTAEDAPLWLWSLQKRRLK